MLHDTELKPPANPGASATATLWDSTADTGTGVTLARRNAFNDVKRVLVSVFIDQAATFFVDHLVPGSTTWRTTNGSGSGEAITASTYFERDNLKMGPDMRLRIVTVTNPTTWEVSIRLIHDRALAQ